MKKILVALILTTTLLTGCSSSNPATTSSSKKEETSSVVVSSTIQSSTPEKTVKPEGTPMYLKPSVFSSETTEILNIFDDTIFLDVSLNESALYYYITEWNYNEYGKWEEKFLVSGQKAEKIDNGKLILVLRNDFANSMVLPNSNSIGLSGCSGKVTSKLDECDEIFDEVIDEQTPIELEKEIVLWSKIGRFERTNEKPTKEQLLDFQNIKCDAGVVYTLKVTHDWHDTKKPLY